MPSTRSSGRRPDDDILSQRLEALGYSIAAPPPPKPPKKTAIELLNEDVAAFEERWRREQGLEDSSDDDNEEEAVDGAESDDAASTSTLPPLPPRSLPAGDADLTLADLLYLVEKHKRAAFAAAFRRRVSKKKSLLLAPLAFASANALQLHPLFFLPRLALSLTLPLALPAALAAPPTVPPLLETITQLVRDVPDLTAHGLAVLIQGVQDSSSLLETARIRSEANGKTLGASFNLLGQNLFRDYPSPPSNPAVAALALSRSLATPTATPSSPLPRILSTRHTQCIQCGSPLVCRSKHTTDSAVLVDVVSHFPAVVATHSCGQCHAIYAPDHVEIAVDKRRVWLFDAEAPALKVGAAVWITSAFARHFRLQLLQLGTTPGAAATLWNSLYAPAGSGPADWSAKDAETDEDEEEDEDDEDEDFLSPAKSPRKRKKPVPFRLRGQHLYRAFVLSSIFSALDFSPYPAFASLSRPFTADLVRIANRDLFQNASQVEANVLGPHQCETCTRERREWNSEAATEEERAAGVRYAGKHEQEKQFVQDTYLVDGPPVQLAVCDGLAIGHSLCAFPSCPNPPEKTRRTRRYCLDHLDQHLLCGVVGCERYRSDELDEEGDLGEACHVEAHQVLWREYKKRRGAMQGMGWTGRRSEKYPVEGVEADESEEEWVSEEERSGKSSGRVETTWSLRRTSNLQLLVAACGTPLSWTKFSERESPAEVVAFLSSTHDQLAPSPLWADEPASIFPTYIAYDRACHVLRHLVSPAPAADCSSSFPSFLLSSTRLILDAFHRKSHPQDDAFCAAFCDPTNLEGEAPDLVVPFVEKKVRGKKQDKTRTFERGFNTSAAEQLNSSLRCHSHFLSSLRADNFDFCVHVILRYRRGEVEKAHEAKRTKALAARGGRKKRGGRK
ncbi:hypothetical protein JCM8097_007496 [Rhodosporidiobolus ruineniae]